MKRSLYKLSGLVFMAIMFWSCEPGDEPFNEHEINSISLTAETTSDCEPSTAFGKSTSINSYTVQYLGFEETNDNTTFKYKVSGNYETPQLDSFILEVPVCEGDLVSWSPEQSASLLEGAIKWNSSVAKDGSQEYSVTYAGTGMAIGFVDATVTRGSIVEKKKILGPCGEAYTLSGSVFIDESGDGSKQASESGISDVKVSLYNKDGTELLTSVCTDKEDGSYSFLVPGGSYTIKVGELLNDEEYTKGSTSISLTNVEENSSDNNFAYTFNSPKAKLDLKSGTLKVNTEPTKFWVNEIRNAGKRNAMYKESEILDYLARIESMFLDKPFKFGMDKRAGALDVLTQPIKTDLDEYRQQLLTAELNVVSGRGVTNLEDKNQDFNYSLLNYAEAVAWCAMVGCSAEVSSQSITTNEISTTSLKTDSDMLYSFNGTGGIGK